MKRVVALIFLLALSLLAMSQYKSINIFGSYTKPMVPVHCEGEFNKKDYSSWGYSAGIGMTRMYNDRVGIDASFTFIDYALCEKKFYNNTYHNVFMYEINVSAKTNIVSFGNFTLYTKEGLFVSYDSDRNSLRSRFKNMPNPYVSSTKFGHSPFSLGVSAGIGLSYLVRERFQFDVYAAYAQGIITLQEINLCLYRDEKLSGNMNCKVRGSSLRLGLGFSYRFKGKNN